MRTSRPHARLVSAAGVAALAFACSDETTPAASRSGGASGANAGGASGNVAGSSGSGGTTAAAGASSSGGAPTSAGTANAGGAANAAGSGGFSGAAASGGSAGSALLPYKGVANSECADLERLSAAWWYNWMLHPDGCDHDEFVPMISGKNEKTPQAVADALTQLSNAGYRTVLGFNEPNKSDQSNLTVAEVVALWPSITSDPAVRVGSPATSADAKSWFDDFMAQAEAADLRVDFVAIHWYGWNAGSCDDADELENYIEWAEGFNRPIWITEWGCLNQSNPSPEVVAGFYAAAIAMFEDHPQIERYAWYPWTANNELVGSGGVLTALGTTFADAPSEK